MELIDLPMEGFLGHNYLTNPNSSQEISFAILFDLTFLYRVHLNVNFKNLCSF